MTTKSRHGRPVPLAHTTTRATPREIADSAEAAATTLKDVRMTVSGLLARTTWLLAGPFALLVTLYGIVNTSSGWVTTLDAVFFVIVGLMIGCRWAEQRSGQGTSAYGEPSTWADFQRYVKALVPLALGAWMVANVLGNHILSSGGGP